MMPSVYFVRSGWTASVDTGTNNLVFRDSVTPGDHRVALLASVSRDVGTERHVSGSATSTLATLGPWSITEENGGVLTFRNSNSGNRYVFFPGSSQDFGCANQAPGLNTRIGVVALYAGVRWVIREVNGVLEFRDLVADSRYTFFPGCGSVNVNAITTNTTCVNHRQQAPAPFCCMCHWLRATFPSVLGLTNAFSELCALFKPVPAVCGSRAAGGSFAWSTS
jgi:hypothetical protein